MEHIFFLEVNSTEVSTRVENYEAPPVHMNACKTKKLRRPSGLMPRSRRRANMAQKGRKHYQALILRPSKKRGPPPHQRKNKHCAHLMLIIT